jgi:hypothetical protein
MSCSAVFIDEKVVPERDIILHIVLIGMIRGILSCPLFFTVGIDMSLNYFRMQNVCLKEPQVLQRAGRMSHQCKLIAPW